LHANLDKKHAEEFFKILEPYVNDPEKKQKIRAGLQLGAYIFNRLYEDLYQETL
jgi:pyrroloquinoline-quinone synthase